MFDETQQNVTGRACTGAHTRCALTSSRPPCACAATNVGHAAHTYTCPACVSQGGMKPLVSGSYCHMHFLAVVSMPSRSDLPPKSKPCMHALGFWHKIDPRLLGQGSWSREHALPVCCRVALSSSLKALNCKFVDRTISVKALDCKRVGLKSLNCECVD